MTEQEHVRQKPREVAVSDKVVTIYPASFNRICEAAEAFLDLLKKTQRVEEAKIAGKKLFDDALANAGGDANKIDLDALKVSTSNLLIDAVESLLKEAKPEVTKLLAIMCKPNGTNAKAPEPFASEQFWMDEATVSEAGTVLSAFIAGIDVRGLLKNVLALKGIV